MNGAKTRQPPSSSPLRNPRIRYRPDSSTISLGTSPTTSSHEDGCLSPTWSSSPSSSSTTNYNDGGSTDGPPAETTMPLHKSLQSLGADTAAELSRVWDEVGYAADDRSAQLAALLTDVRRLCRDRVRGERDVADQFRNAIADAVDEIRSLCRRMRLEADEGLLRGERGGDGRGTPTLTDHLAALESELEGRLRPEAESAGAELARCRDELARMHNFLGECVEAGEMTPSWLDVESDLSRRRVDEFRARVDEIGRVVEDRVEATVGRLSHCRRLLTELGVDTDGSALDRKIVSSLTDGGGDDSSAPQNPEQPVLRSLWASETCTGISSAALEEIGRRIGQLEEEKKRRRARLESLGEDIAALWERLGVPDDEQLAFTRGVHGLGEDTIARGEAELRRLRALKAERMAGLVADARATIERLWEEAGGAGPRELEVGGGGGSGVAEMMGVMDESLFTDDLLARHEDHIAYLRSRLERMRPIIRLIERREEILAERDRYEELQRDPDRLQQRGSALTRQLMMEEKMAKHIRKDLPKLTQLLRKKLRGWHRENGESFLYGGCVYLEVMKKQEDDWRAYKERKAQRLRERHTCNHHH